jgi:UDP-N-acetylglucosamine/UDP-N-acetylgalactosamine diphosphorylase
LKASLSSEAFVVFVPAKFRSRHPPMSAALENSQYAALMRLLEPLGQAHLLRFWSELSADRRQRLAQQIQAIDWETFATLTAAETGQQDWEQLAAQVAPPQALSLLEQAEPQRMRAAVAAGEEALARGQVGFILVAGGQGSRLGFEHPKGMFPIGPVSGRSLFQILLEHARARSLRAGAALPVFIMTSPQTDQETRQFLAANDWFGYPPADIRIFCQGVIPAVDRQTRQILLAEKDELFANPDGHGGCLAALARAGLLEEMRQRGIEQLFYGQVDNPLLQVCQPALLGHHLLSGSEVTTQVVRKLDPGQKVGNVVRWQGRTQIIEYSDIPASLASQRNAGGDLRFWAGSIAVHVFAREFLERCAAQAETLPFHRALKKVTSLDDQGRKLQPDEPNAIKFERFIFDLLPHAREAIVVEVDPALGFAAVKNAPPAAAETPEWVQAAISRLHRHWLRQAGAEVADNLPVEISPFVALDGSDLLGRIRPGTKFTEPVWLAPG